jgi:hypothetical protein
MSCVNHLFHAKHRLPITVNVTLTNNRRLQLLDAKIFLFKTMNKSYNISTLDERERETLRFSAFGPGWPVSYICRLSEICYNKFFFN